jgi:hypothetical protein
MSTHWLHGRLRLDSDISHTGLAVLPGWRYTEAKLSVWLCLYIREVAHAKPSRVASLQKTKIGIEQALYAVAEIWAR